MSIKDPELKKRIGIYRRLVDGDEEALEIAVRVEILSLLDRIATTLESVEETMKKIENSFGNWTRNQ